MTILKWTLIAIVAIAVVAVLAGQLGLLHGTPPTDLGVKNGRLKAPSLTPNSVSSQADLWPDHPQRASARIAPLALGGDPATRMARLRSAVQAMPGAVVVTANNDYLYAQFTTALMKYTDDVEFWLEPGTGLVQLRSASRLGQGDLGANRKRIETLRASLAASGAG